MTKPTTRQSPSPEVQQLAKTLLETVDELGAVVAREVLDRIPLYAESGVVSPDDLVASCTDNARFVIDGLARGEIGDPAPAGETGVRRAQADVPLSAVLAAYRVGFRALWEEVTRQAASHGIPAETVLATTADAMVMHDVFTEAMSAAYNATLTQRLVHAEAQRSALVETVLAGTVVDRRTLWEVADLLGLPVTGTYVVVAALLSSPARSALPGMEAELARHGCHSAWRLMPEAQVGVIELGGLHVERLVELLDVDDRVRVGVSPVFDELVGAARAVQLARLAAASTTVSGGVARFGDNPIGVAAAASGDVVGQLADDVLGALDALAEAERYTLLETLQVWVQVGGSASKTASRLSCHANTVRHRLRRFEDMTGRRLDRPRDVAALCLALAAREG